MKIPHNFIPRVYQVPLLQALELRPDGTRAFNRAVSVWHRRSGKDKTFINLMAREAIRTVGTYFYFFPTYNQGRKILWQGMDKAGFPFLGHIPQEARVRTNNTEMLIELFNGSIFQVVGTDNIDSIVGTNPIGCVFSEYSLQDPRAWLFIRPILAENGGWACFNFTPRGMNHGWELYSMALDNPDTWHCELLTVDDTGVLSKEDIAKERREGASEEFIAQEYYCSFAGSQEGAYYASQLRQAREEGRICKVPVVPGVSVDTFWDIGVRDATAIWFIQVCGRELHVVDYYENKGEGLPHYAEVLRQKGYYYGEFVFPHDMEAQEFGSGFTRISIARNLFGVNVKTAVKPGFKEDAIEAVRNMLKICWFDEEKCSYGLQALHSFRKEFDEKNRIHKPQPVHDWSIHAADALQTAALGSKMFRGQRRASYAPVVMRSAAGWT